MPDPLSAADIAEGRRLMQALADPRTGSEADGQMAAWLFGHLPALLDAAEAVVRARFVLASLPYSVLRCDVHPDDDPVSCGWKRTVGDIETAIEGRQAGE